MMRENIPASNWLRRLSFIYWFVCETADLERLIALVTARSRHEGDELGENDLGFPVKTPVMQSHAKSKL